MATQSIAQNDLFQNELYWPFFLVVPDSEFFLFSLCRFISGVENDYKTFPANSIKPKVVTSAPWKGGPMFDHSRIKQQNLLQCRVVVSQYHSHMLHCNRWHSASWFRQTERIVRSIVPLWVQLKHFMLVVIPIVSSESSHIIWKVSSSESDQLFRDLLYFLATFEEQIQDFTRSEWLVLELPCYDVTLVVFIEHRLMEGPPIQHH